MHTAQWLTIIVLVSLQPVQSWWLGKGRRKPPNKCSSKRITSWSACRHRCGDISRRQVSASCTHHGNNLQQCASVCGITDTRTSQACYPGGCHSSQYCCPNREYSLCYNTFNISFLIAMTLCSKIFIPENQPRS